MNYTGTSGNNTITGTSSADTFNMGQGGDDTVNGGAGDDVFNYGGAFDELDTINGGSGDDVLNLNGNYASQFFIADGTLTSVEKIQLADGHSYNFFTDDKIVAANTNMTVNGSALTGSNTLTFDGSSETQGHFTLEGGLGNDVLTGGSGNDIFYDRNGGNDKAFGGGGSDTFNFGAALTGADTIDGGSGTTNKLNITGDYTGSHALTMSATTINDLNSVVLGAGFNYVIATADEMSGQGYTLDASALAAANTLTLNASHNTQSILTVKGGAGNDVFNFGAGYLGGAITGGGGSDTLELSGDYSSVRPLGDGNLVGVGHIVLGAGHSYNFDLSDGDLTAGQTLTFNGSALGSGDFLAVDALPITLGSVVLEGGAGDDQIQPDGGNDIVKAGAGNDLILYFNNDFTGGVSIDGGTGSDELVLSGDYSHQVTFTNTTMTNVEAIVVEGDFSYSLKLADGNLNSTTPFQIDGDYTSAADQLIFNDSAETNANVTVDGGMGDDVITAGGGEHHFNGSDGNDNFFMLGFLKATDAIDGGTGSDGVTLLGDYSAGITFSATTLTNVEQINLTAGHSYKITTNDATVAAGQNLTVNGGTLGAGDVLTFSGVAETNGTFTLVGGAGNDSLLAGAGNDTLTGGGGADTLQGRNGNDTYVYTAVSDSTSTTYDTILGFSATRAHLDVLGTVTGVDTAITSGTLSTASFDTDLAAAVNSGTLAAHHAVLFTPNAGTLSGDTFLIVDENGTAGYQAGGDLVIDLANGESLSSLSAANFI